MFKSITHPIDLRHRGRGYRGQLGGFVDAAVPEAKADRR
jgi:hypothetical protein